VSADILETIDGALADWAASGDAMRWNPEPSRVICDGGKPLRLERPTPWQSWSRVADGSDPLAEWECMLPRSPAAYAFYGGSGGSYIYLGYVDAASMRTGREHDGSGYTRATVTAPQEWDCTFTFTVAAQIAEAFGFSWDGELHYHAAGVPSRGCRACNPSAFPRKLPIDGREYARRRAARKRRRWALP